MPYYVRYLSTKTNIDRTSYPPRSSYEMDENLNLNISNVSGFCMNTNAIMSHPIWQRDSQNRAFHLRSVLFFNSFIKRKYFLGTLVMLIAERTIWSTDIKQLHLHMLNLNQIPLEDFQSKIRFDKILIKRTIYSDVVQHTCLFHVNSETIFSYRLSSTFAHHAYQVRQMHVQLKHLTAWLLCITVTACVHRCNPPY